MDCYSADMAHAYDDNSVIKVEQMKSLLCSATSLELVSGHSLVAVLVRLRWLAVAYA
jgi:hypothetical protein